MKNKQITRKITQGMYVLTISGGGCIVDAVSQVSAGDHPYISVAVMKTNHTCSLLESAKTFALSVLGMNETGEVIQKFGFNSMRDMDKFAEGDFLEVENLKVIQNSLGYMICEIVDKIDMGSHILYIGKLVEADVLQDEIPMSYGYYQAHKDELLRVTTESGKTAWVCTLCGYVYYGDILPVGYRCPKCGADASAFEKKG